MTRGPLIDREIDDDEEIVPISHGALRSTLMKALSFAEA
jgi:hypothetical protein